jgi:hypothetical protein
VLVASSWTVPLLGLLVNAALALGSYWIARDGFARPRGLERALAAGVVFWSACTVGLEVLGSFGAIGLGPMAAWACSILALGAGLRRLRRGRPADPSPPAEPPLSWDALLALALVLTAALIWGLPSLSRAVKVVSDGPIYHLYFAARWWKAGRLILVAAPFGENAATYFPANGDLWFTWLMATWGGETLAKVGQAPFLLLAGAAAYGCARTLGAGRSAGLIATAWFVSSTPLFIYSFEPNVDTIFVAGYLLAVYFFLQVVQGAGGWGALVLGCLAAGAALGTKAVGVVFLPPLIALMIAAIWLQSAPVPIKVLRTLAVVLVPFLTGGYWFLRNASLTGNPIYPLDVSWMARTLWAGWYGPRAMQTSQYYLPAGDWRALGDTLLAIMDPRLAPLWVAALIGAWTPRRPRTPARRRVGIFSLLAVLNIAQYWVLIPYRTQQRFMLQALGVAVVPLAALLERGRWVRRAAALLLGLHVLTPQSWPFPTREDAIPWDLSPLIPNAIGALVPIFPGLEASARARGTLGPALNTAYLGMILAAVLMTWAWGRAAPGIRPGPRRALGAAATAAFLLLGLVSQGIGPEGGDPQFRFYPPFPDFYLGWVHFDARCGPAGARVAYAGTNLPYFLLGRGLRNEVRYINIDSHRDWLLHDYHREARRRGQGSWPNSRPGWDRIRPDFRAWLENLDAEGIQLLVVTRVNSDAGPHNAADPERFPIERRWADSHPDRFEPLYGAKERDPWFRLYRVRRPGASGPPAKRDPDGRPIRAARAAR